MDLKTIVTKDGDFTFYQTPDATDIALVKCCKTCNQAFQCANRKERKTLKRCLNCSLKKPIRYKRKPQHFDN